MIFESLWKAKTANGRLNQWQTLLLDHHHLLIWIDRPIGPPDGQTSPMSNIRCQLLNYPCPHTACSHEFCFENHIVSSSCWKQTTDHHSSNTGFRVIASAGRGVPNRNHFLAKVDTVKFAIFFKLNPSVLLKFRRGGCWAKCDSLFSIISIWEISVKVSLKQNQCIHTTQILNAVFNSIIH